MQKFLHVFIFSIFTIALTFSPVASRSQGMADEELALQRIEDRINSMEKNMSTIQQEVYRNNKGGKNKDKSSSSSEPIGMDDERTRKFNGKIEELEHSIDMLATKLDKIIADIDFRIAALEKKAKETPVTQEQSKPAETSGDTSHNAPEAAVSENNESVSEENADAAIDAAVEEKSKNVVSAPAKPAPAKISSATQYDKALELMRANKYDESEKALKDFITHNPKSDLLDNAIYWLGETYYLRKNYQQAAVNFLKGYREYPKGDQAANSLFKLALSLKGMQKEKEACATLDKMKKEYPSADKALLAKVKAEKSALKCK